MLLIFWTTCLHISFVGFIEYINLQNCCLNLGKCENIMMHKCFDHRMGMHIELCILCKKVGLYTKKPDCPHAAREYGMGGQGLHLVGAASSLLMSLYLLMRKG